MGGQTSNQILQKQYTFLEKFERRQNNNTAQKSLPFDNKKNSNNNSNNGE